LGPSYDYDPGAWCNWPSYGSRSTIVVHEEASEVSDESSVKKWKDSTPEALAQRFVELGDLYFKTRRYALASDAYEKAVDLVEKDGSLRFVFADALFATGDYDRAAIEIRQGLVLHPSLAESGIDKHGFYGFPKDFDDHIAALRTYLKRRPFDSNARLVLLYNLRFGGGTEAQVLEVAKVLATHLPGDPTVEALLAPIRAKK
jgi:tetratricopeptide (TPR) repeat protein